ncbi:MAG: hypothetical protein WBL88_06615 [Nitrososphaeraceae archaeon]
MFNSYTLTFESGDQHHLKIRQSDFIKSVNIAKIIRSENRIQLILYDDNLNFLESDSYADNYTLNFYLQTLPRKYKIKKALLIIHDKNKNSVEMFIADDENSFFIS